MSKLEFELVGLSLMEIFFDFVRSDMPGFLTQERRDWQEMRVNLFSGQCFMGYIIIMYNYAQLSQL